MTIQDIISKATRHRAAKMSAKLTPDGNLGSDFKADELFLSNGQTLVLVGLSGDVGKPKGYDAVALFFPADIANGDHDIQPYENKSVAAWFEGKIGGYALSGKVENLQWDRATGKISGQFHFVGEDSVHQAFKVENGSFSAESI